jgi:hypothetical protein
MATAPLPDALVPGCPCFFHPNRSRIENPPDPNCLVQRDSNPSVPIVPLPSICARDPQRVALPLPQRDA